jgi:hypothetical protein
VQNIFNAQGLNLSLWKETTQTTIYILNRIGSKTHDSITTYDPYEGHKPVVGYFQTCFHTQKVEEEA